MHKKADLHDILVTPELERRKSRPVNVFAEKRVLALLERRITYGRDAVFQVLCELALELCNADSSGVSVVRESGEDAYFTWDTLAGKFAPLLGGIAPRYDSPCGVCLDLGSTQLFAHPERYFSCIPQSGTPIVEALVVPLYGENQTPYGTIWTLMHNNLRAFDKEDARIMTVLGRHASQALQAGNLRTG